MVRDLFAYAFGELESAGAFSGPIGLKSTGRRGLRPGRRSTERKLQRPQTETRQIAPGKIGNLFTDSRLTQRAAPAGKIQQLTQDPRNTQRAAPAGKARQLTRPLPAPGSRQAPAGKARALTTPTPPPMRARGKLPPGFAGFGDFGDVPTANNAIAWVSDTAIALQWPRLYASDPGTPVLWPDGTPATSRLWLPALDMSGWFDPVKYVNDAIRGSYHENRIQGYYKDPIAFDINNAGWRDSDYAREIFGSRAWEWILDPWIPGAGPYPKGAGPGDWRRLDFDGLTRAGRAWLDPIRPPNPTPARWRFPASFDWTNFNPSVQAPIWLYLNMTRDPYVSWRKVPAALYRFDLQPGDPEQLPPLAWLALDFLDAIQTGAHGFPVLATTDANGTIVLDTDALAAFLATPAGQAWEPLILDPVGRSMLANIDDEARPLPQRTPMPARTGAGVQTSAGDAGDAAIALDVATVDSVKAWRRAQAQAEADAAAQQDQGYYPDDGGYYPDDGGYYPGQLIPTEETEAEALARFEDEIAGGAAIIGSDDFGAEDLAGDLTAEDLAALAAALDAGQLGAEDLAAAGLSLEDLAAMLGEDGEDLEDLEDWQG